MTQKKQNPGALAGATGADFEAGQLHSDDTTGAPKRKPTRQQVWRQRQPLAYAAHLHVGTLRRLGLLTPGPCEVCGAEKVDAHHDDYSAPGKVRWLCRKHHKAAHRKGGGK